MADQPIHRRARHATVGVTSHYSAYGLPSYLMTRREPQSREKPMTNELKITRTRWRIQEQYRSGAQINTSYTSQVSKVAFHAGRTDVVRFKNHNR